jgi:mRNA interferase MazF
MGVVARRFEVYLVNLDPTVGHEMKKLTTKGRPYPTRVACTFQGKRGQIVLEQIRAIDRIRLVKRLGKLTGGQAAAVPAVSGAMFAQ